MKSLKSPRGLALTLLCLVAGGIGSLVAYRRAETAQGFVLPEGVRTAKVYRTDLQLTLTASGTVDSAERTLIECEVERMGMREGGASLSAGEILTIIYVLPEGTDVAKGDVICELDSSEYVELVEQQKLQVEQARTDYRTAELALTNAESTLREFDKGLNLQSLQSLQGDIILAEANLETAIDRLNFSERMAGFGYVAPTKLAGDRLTRMKMDEALKTARRALEIYKGYEVPKIVLQLEGQVEVARSQLSYQRLRFNRHQERLNKFQEQVDRCTIRAPHDGFLVYANEDDDDGRIEEGALVKAKQDMFYLPDLSRMQIHTLVHESIYQGVQPGMPTRVRVVALADRDIEGHVVSVAPLPYRPKDWKANPDVKNFLAKVELHASPRSLRPGMSASVEILTGDRHDALVVPTGAVVMEDGTEYCYVAGPEGVERRAVTLDGGTTDLYCVADGLADGEDVILDPQSVLDLLPIAERPEPAIRTASEPAVDEPVTEDAA